MSDINDFQEKNIWAVVGSIHNKEKYAYKIYNFLKRKGYRVYAVDPKGEMVDGDKSYKTLSELPETPDAVDMVINPVKGREYIEEAKNLNIRYIWFQPGAESEELIKLSESYGMNIIRDHCVMVDFI